MNEKHLTGPPWWVPHVGLYILTGVVIYMGMNSQTLGLLLSVGGMGQALWGPIPFLVSIIACMLTITVASFAWIVLNSAWAAACIVWRWTTTRRWRKPKPVVLTERVRSDDGW